MAESNPILPVLSAFPLTLAPLQERIANLGYLDLEVSTPEQAGAMDFPMEPAVAILPLSSQSRLDEISRTIQTFKARFPEAQVLAVLSGRAPFNSNDVYRVGATGFFRLPFEEEIFINKIFEHSPVDAATKDLTFDQLMRVSVVELERAKTFDFDIYLYLPMNRRAILYIEKGRPIDEKTIKKFKDNRHYNLYVKRAQIKSYLAYCNRVLSSATDQSATETERAKQKAGKLSSLMGTFFSDDSLGEEESRMMLENLKSVSSLIEDQPGAGGSKAITNQVSKFASGQLTHFSHAQNVAAYCTLFGMALGFNEPETLRMGGLLHDLGLSDLPNELIWREIDEMSEEEAATYRLHPGGGKYSVESRKLDVPQGVLDMILYHHERPDGSGYPYGKKASEIPPLAKICAFADEFDLLTSVRPGKRQLSPHEAMRRLAGLDGKPAHPVYEEAFHKPIVDLFLSQPEHALEAAAQFGGVNAPGAAAHHGKIRIEDEGSGHHGSGNVITIEALLRQARYQAEPASPGSGDPAAQVLLQDLRSQLNSHWASKARSLEA